MAEKQRVAAEQRAAALEHELARARREAGRRSSVLVEPRQQSESIAAGADVLARIGALISEAEQRAGAAAAGHRDAVVAEIRLLRS